MQLSPARGRLPTFTFYIIARELLDAAYPREGTVTHPGCSLEVSHLMQLIPARGRLLYSMSLLSHSFRCSLSPRGDGYKKNLRRLSTLKSMQLIPARGRLPNVSSVQNAVVMMQLIPARGRLHPLRQNHPHQRGCSLSPRGDGYVKSIACRSLYFQMQLIPARGRLPELLSDDFNHKGMQLSPARGLRPYVFSGKFPSFY